MGSGSLAAMAIFEHKWQPNMTVFTFNNREKKGLISLNKQ